MRAILTATLASCLVACVTDSNRCLPGFVYTAQYDGCLPIASDAGDAGAADGAAAAGESGSEAGEGGAGLGATCNADADCSGAATYCLKDPTAPASNPGECTILHCTAAACGGSFACCDCSASALPPLKGWPAPLCAPVSNKSMLSAFGCTCQ